MECIDPLSPMHGWPRINASRGQSSKSEVHQWPRIKNDASRARHQYARGNTSNEMHECIDAARIGRQMKRIYASRITTQKSMH
eukprot:scaffold92118_cov20-Tisochrysis_lutea.AAC.3